MKISLPGFRHLGWIGGACPPTWNGPWLPIGLSWVNIAAAIAADDIGLLTLSYILFYFLLSDSDSGCQDRSHWIRTAISSRIQVLLAWAYFSKALSSHFLRTLGPNLRTVPYGRTHPGVKEINIFKTCGGGAGVRARAAPGPCAPAPPPSQDLKTLILFVVVLLPPLPWRACPLWGACPPWGACPLWEACPQSSLP